LLLLLLYIFALTRLIPQPDAISASLPPLLDVKIYDGFIVCILNFFNITFIHSEIKQHNNAKNILTPKTTSHEYSIEKKSELFSDCKKMHKVIGSVSPAR